MKKLTMLLVLSLLIVGLCFAEATLQGPAQAATNKIYGYTSSSFPPFLPLGSVPLFLKVEKKVGENFVQVGEDHETISAPSVNNIPSSGYYSFLYIGAPEPGVTWYITVGPKNSAGMVSKVPYTGGELQINIGVGQGL